MLAVLLAGCGGNVYVQGSSGSGAGVSTTGSTVNVQGRSVLGNAIAIGMLVGISYGSERALEDSGERRTPRPYAEPPQRGVPAPDPTRRVV